MRRHRPALLLHASSFVLVFPLIATFVALVASPVDAQPGNGASGKHFARVSVAPGGKELRGANPGYQAWVAAISDDAKIAVFGSEANNLVPAGSGHRAMTGLYVKDLTTGAIELLPGSNTGGKAALSADGRYVAYSDGCRLVRYDRVTGEHRALGFPTEADTDCYFYSSLSMSANGRYLVFSPRPQVGGSSTMQVYRLDVDTYALDLVSKTDAGVPGDLYSSNGAISGDGTVVAFFTNASNLGGVTGQRRLVVRDFKTSQLELHETVAELSAIALSHDGHLVAIRPSAGALIIDRSAGSTSTVPNDGPTLMDEGPISMDAAGTTLAFSAVTGAYPWTLKVVVYDIATQTRRDAARAIDGGLPNDSSGAGSLSRDGKTLIFTSLASNLVVDDTNFLVDAFTVDLASNTLKRVSVSATGVQGMGGFGTTSPPAISGDGNTVVYQTMAPNATGSPLPSSGGEFLLDRRKGRMQLLQEGVWQSPVISDDARYVLIPRPELSSDVPPVRTLAAVLEVATGVRHMIYAPDEHADVRTITMSRDGSVVAFVGNGYMVGGTFYQGQVWRCVTATGQCEVVSKAPNGDLAVGNCDFPVLSADGRFLAFASLAANLGARSRVEVFVHDSQSGSLANATLQTDLWGVALAGIAMSGDGRFIAFPAIVPRVLPPGTPTGQGIYILDRQSGSSTLISDLADGTPNPWWCDGPSMSADGGQVAFACAEVRDATDETPSKIYVHDRRKGQTESVFPFDLNAPARWPMISGDGKHLAFVTSASNLIEDDTNWAPDVFVLDLEPKLAIKGVWPPSVETGKPTPIEIRGSGFQHAASAGQAAMAGAPPVVRIGGVVATDVRVVSDTLIVATLPPLAGSTDVADVVVDFGAPDIVAELPISVGHVTTGGAAGDADGDGMTDSYEMAMGFDAAIGNASEDADGDGLPNGQEFANGTHPLGGHVQGYLAEGATRGFDDHIALLNPGLTTSRVLVKALTSEGERIVTALSMPPTSRASLDMGQVPGLEAAEFSTVIEANDQVLFSRALVWGDGEGSHAEIAIPQPATQWYFAEGATHSGLQLFYLLQNANPTPATVTVRYLKPAPSLPVTRTYVVGAARRLTIWANTDPETDGTDLSAVITSDVPIVAERAVYRDAPGVPFAAGHESAGVTTPTTSWFLAEGATGPYLDLFVLIANPNTQPAVCSLSFLLPDGTVIPRPLTVAPSSRDTIWVDAEGGRLADTAVSTQVTCNQPVIVERAMWWPGDATTWTESHNSAGAVTTGTKWAVPDGEEGGASDAETYILVANMSAFAGAARVTLMFEDGTTTQRVIPLLANSRTNVAVGAPDEAGGFGGAAANRRFGAIVESVDTGAGLPQTVVERSVYSSAHGHAWAAGSNTLGVKLR